MKELRLNVKEYNPRTVLNYISNAKNDLIEPDDYASYAQGHMQSAVAVTFPKYQKILKVNNALDFDDLLTRTVYLLKGRAEVLDRYQSLFKFVLVDEYQDTNQAQYQIVNLIARKHSNICVVGDDDQAIYSWRGATIKNILSFEQDYPRATVIKLEQNYRSTKDILDAAFEVIRHNKSRKQKKLWTDQKEGSPIVIYTALDEVDEARFVADQIEQIQNSGVALNKTAILYRTNAQSRSMEEAMLSFGIPYQIYGGISFYQRKEIKDILAYLRILYNPLDSVSLKRIINTPPRKIGVKTIEALETFAQNEKKSMCEVLKLIASDDDSFPLSHNGLKEFSLVYEKCNKACKELTVGELIEFVLEQSRYLKHLDDGSPENEGRIENIKELLSVAEKYSDHDPENGLSEFLNEVSLIEEQQLKAELKKDKNRVSLMTLHSAKGLEFEYVFIIGMEEGLFPHSRSYVDQEEMEEERRLAYVGITRAKTHLYLVHAESRKYFGSTQNNLISRFVEDIPESLTERTHWKLEESADEEDTGLSDNSSHDQEQYVRNVSRGDAVSHVVFGRGRVIDINEDTITIQFETEGTKELSIEYANLTKV